MVRLAKWIAPILFFILAQNVFAQRETDIKDLLYNLSLEELMNLDISVTNKNIATNIRETPGVLSIISSDEIEMSGARDLMDILQRLVPGLSFGTDVEGVTGIAIRGLWAHEGKLLLMVNGKSINDEQFATTQFGNHFNAELIERIEIIRGPGSSMYGGYAGLGVINIITKKPKNKGSVSVTNSITKDNFTHKNIAISAGIKEKELQIAINASYNQGYRSNLEHKDFYDKDTSFVNANQLNSILCGFNLNYKNLDVSYLLDKYETTTIDLWGSYSSVPYREIWDTHVSEMNYKFEFGDFELTPYIKYKYQLPWNTEMIPEGYTNKKHVVKTTGGFIGRYAFTKEMNLTFGGETYEQNLIWPEDPSNFEEMERTGNDRMSIRNAGVFGQGDFKTKWLNFTAGARFDSYNKFGNSFVPRLAITKLIKSFHIKGMISGSYRIPGGIIPNRTYTLSTDISPERVWSYELEAGYRFTEHSWFVINGFYHDLKDVIVYQTDGAIGYYINGGRSGSSGIEATYRFVNNFLMLNFNYSYYKPMGNKENMYITPGHGTYYLGMAKHRINLNGSIKINESAYFSATGRVYGKRYGIAGYMIDNRPIIVNDIPVALIDINLQLKNLFLKNIDLSLGINNALNRKFVYYQPYDGGHAGLPAAGRAFVLQGRYHF